MERQILLIHGGAVIEKKPVTPTNPEKSVAISEFSEIWKHLSAAVKGEITIGGRRLPPEERDDRMKVSPCMEIARPLELPHPFVDGALFLAPWVTGKAPPSLIQSRRKKKPGACLS